MEALVEAVQATPGIQLICGKRAQQVNEDAAGVSVSFEDCTKASADLLIGCDGVHSFIRNHHVDPDRKQFYTGVANAFGFLDLRRDEDVHFEVSAINIARRGLLLTSFHEHTKTSGYVGAIIEVPDVGS